jgi:hypothetical protein
MLNDYEEGIMLCDQLKSLHKKEIKEDNETTPTKAIEYAIKVEETIQEGLKTITKSISSISHLKTPSEAKDSDMDKVSHTQGYVNMQLLMRKVMKK